MPCNKYLPSWLEVFLPWQLVCYICLVCCHSGKGHGPWHERWSSARQRQPRDLTRDLVNRFLKESGRVFKKMFWIQIDNWRHSCTVQPLSEATVKYNVWLTPSYHIVLWHVIKCQQCHHQSLLSSSSSITVSCFIICSSSSATMYQTSSSSSLSSPFYSECHQYHHQPTSAVSSASPLSNIIIINHPHFHHQSQQCHQYHLHQSSAVSSPSSINHHQQEYHLHFACTIFINVTSNVIIAMHVPSSSTWWLHVAHKSLTKTIISIITA